VLCLDTDALLWWQAEHRKLTKTARRAIEKSQSVVVSAITWWEVATLLAQQRIAFDRPLTRWLLDMEEEDRIADKAPSRSRISQVPQDHRCQVADGLDIHLIVDNYATHKTVAVKRWLIRNHRFHVHFTPTSSSRLNLVERWFGLRTERQIRRGAHRSTVQLQNAIEQYIAHTNSNPKPFVWTKTADQILQSVARYCERIEIREATSGSGH